MGRKQRSYESGAIYHITQRGNNKSYIFEDRFDKEAFLEILEGVHSQMPFHLLHYVLMGNHYHLLIEMKDHPISDIMKQINQTYSRFYNAKYSRVGTNYGGRCDVRLVDSEPYFYRLIHYFAHNPVKAQLVKDPKEYLWCGHKEIVGERIGVLSREVMLERIHTDMPTALEIYNALIEKKAFPIEEDKDLKVNQKLRALLERQLLNPDLCEDVLSRSRNPRAVANRSAFIGEALKKGFKAKDIATFLGLTTNWVLRGRFH